MGDLQHHKCQSYEDLKQLKYRKCLVYYSINFSKSLEQNETCFMEVRKKKMWQVILHCSRSPILTETFEHSVRSNLRNQALIDHKKSVKTEKI